MLAAQSRRAVLPAELSSTCRPFPRHSRSLPPAHPSPGVLRLTGCGDPQDQAPGTLGPVGQAHPPPRALLPAGTCLRWRGSPVQRASRHHAPGQGARSACPLCSSTASPAALGIVAPNPLCGGRCPLSARVRAAAGGSPGFQITCNPPAASQRE